jgi:hypothetical protein
MRMLQSGFQFLALGLALLFNMQPVAAQPAVGCDAAYLRGFEVQNSRGQIIWRPGEIECVEYFRFIVNTPGGQRTFRGIGDISARALLRPGEVARVEAAARRAAASMPALGDYRVDNVTFLMSVYGSAYETARGSREETVLAWANDSSRRPANECPVTLFLFQRYVGNEIQDTVAHELFHCIQFRSLSSAHWQTYNGLGHWWLEGSAELFAMYVGRSNGSTSPFAREFSSLSNAGRPLYSTGYASVVFFAWHHRQSSGIGSLLPFLRRMATTPGEAAQRAALRAVLPNDSLLRFATDFDDRAINYPSGQPVDTGTDLIKFDWWIARNDTHRTQLRPFVLTRGMANYSCGVWDNRVQPNQINASVRREADRTWVRAWPSETDCRRPDQQTFRFVAMHTGDANVDMSLRVDRRLACTSCLPAGESHIDACLVGTWELTGGGPMEWMARRMGRAPFTRNNNSKMKVTMFDDGVFRSEAMAVDFQTTLRQRDKTTKYDVRGRSVASFGYWSARNGTMRACTLDFSAQGTVTGTKTTERQTSVHSSPSSFRTGPTDGESKYNCSPTTYKSSIRMSDGSDMDFVFTRLSPPPR